MTCREFLQSLVLFGFGGVLALQSGATVALAVVDQAQPLSPTSIDSNSANPRGQTFTVGVSGVLTSVGVKLAQLQPPAEPIHFALQATAGGFPTGAPLAELDIPISSIPPWAGSSDAMSFVDIDLSPFALDVAAGDILAMTLVTGDGGPNVVNYRIGASHDNPYADGTGLFRASDSLVWNTLDGQWDLSFQTLVNPVPEPSSIAVIGGCAIVGLLLGTRMHRERKKPSSAA
jgi:hypothetical protein